MLSGSQKQLILEVLKKERGRLLSRHKGELLNKTIDDLAQMLRNETVNAPNVPDSALDWGSRRK